MRVHFWNLRSSLNPFLQECHRHHNLDITFLFSYQPRPRTTQNYTPYSSSLDSSKTPFATHMGAKPCVSHTHSSPYSGHLVGGDLKQVQFPTTMTTTQFIQHPPQSSAIAIWSLDHCNKTDLDHFLLFTSKQCTSAVAPAKPAQQVHTKQQQIHH